MSRKMNCDHHVFGVGKKLVTYYAKTSTAQYPHPSCLAEVRLRNEQEVDDVYMKLASLYS